MFLAKFTESKRTNVLSLLAEALRSEVIGLLAEVARLLECGAFAGLEFVSCLATSQARLALVPIREWGGAVRCGAVAGVAIC